MVNLSCFSPFHYAVQFSGEQYTSTVTDPPLMRLEPFLGGIIVVVIVVNASIHLMLTQFPICTVVFTQLCTDFMALLQGKDL
jgi:uncharacterized membrane protein